MGISLSSTHLPARAATSTWRPSVLRAALIAGCAVAVAGTSWLADRGAVVNFDPALARLLRGMALIKSLALLAAVGAVLWRLGRPAKALIVGCYLAALWSMTCATVLIWHVTQIPLAAVTFHLALIVFLVAGWRDDLERPTAIIPAAAARRTPS